MNKTVGLLLIVYSLLLAGLSYFVYQLAPGLTRPTLIGGLAGGALCLVWGVRGIGGGRGKALPVLTLIPVSFVLLSQTFTGWWGGSGGLQAGRTAAAIITLLLVLSVAMLVRIAWSGVVFDVPASGRGKGAGAKSETTTERTAEGKGGKTPRR